MKRSTVFTAIVMSCLLALNQSVAGPAVITIDVSKEGPKVSPTLWGIFFEDINLSADGGIYPELVRNRSFDDSDKPTYWTALGKASIAIDTGRPINPNNTKALKVVVSGMGGVINEGYWGVAIRKGEKYRLSLMARGTVSLKAALENYDGSVIHCESSVGAMTDDWKRREVDLTAAATDPKARLVIRADKPGVFWLDMVSLVPATTWKGHGLRPDLCEMLAEMRPAFTRFPGGCWVEGDTMEKAYRWKKTIGDIAEREPLWNIWGYYATHGLGFHEYLQLCEDLGSEPLFCINVGMSHKEVVPMNKMDEYVQDALDVIEYANGDVNTKWGAVRARAGHPKPFNLKYMEIGNENGGPAYSERWPLFYKAIKAKHPDMKLISNVWGGYPSDPKPDIIDEHYYDSPEFFNKNFNKYDTYDRNGPKVFVGEYAVTRDCGKGNLRGAIGEAAFMLGLERNSDVVVMAAYAPLFVNVNHRRWNPDLINFDSSRVYGLPSYYVQKMFAQNRGDVVLSTSVTPAASELDRKYEGAIGVGTWHTQAEYKDIKVTQGEKVLFASEFSKDATGWKFIRGDWKAVEGVLRQSSGDENVRALAGGPDLRDYTLSLKARKLGGAEGFLVCFGVRNVNEKSWWNLGGWGNTRHAVEVPGLEDKGVNGSIETGRWYDIAVEVKGGSIKCYLDGKLVHDLKAPRTCRDFHASATREGKDIILKAVNFRTEPMEGVVELGGAIDIETTAKVTTLTSASGEDENSLDQPVSVYPADSVMEGARSGMTYNFPANSLTVIRFKGK